MALYIGNKKVKTFFKKEKLKNEWFKPRLPFDYQEVKYIEAPAKVEAYIDLGFAFSVGASIEIDFWEFTAEGNGAYIFGAAENSGALRCMITDVSGKGSLGYGSTGSAYFELNKKDVYTADTFNRYKLNLKQGSAEFINETANTIVTSTRQGSYVMTNHLYLFARNYNGTLQCGNGPRRIRSFKYYNKDNILVCDLVPCYKKDTLEAGMYNLVNKTFLTSSGAGDFIRGEAVNFGSSAGEYMELEWLSALSGVAAYIDLGFVFDTACKIQMLQYIGDIKVAYPFGAVENSGVNRCAFSNPYPEGENGTFYGTSVDGYIGPSLTNSMNNWNEYEFTLKPGELITAINKTTGQEYKSGKTQKSYTMASNLYLFAQNYNGAPRFGAERKISYFKYYDKNNNLICDLIPCIQLQTGIIGMYDKARDLFLTNAGMGSFIAGPIKTI